MAQTPEETTPRRRRQPPTTTTNTTTTTREMDPETPHPPPTITVVTIGATGTPATRTTYDHRTRPRNSHSPTTDIHDLQPGARSPRWSTNTAAGPSHHNHFSSFVDPEPPRQNQDALTIRAVPPTRIFDQPIRTAQPHSQHGRTIPTSPTSPLCQQSHSQRRP